MTYREPTDEEWLAIIRGRPTAPTVYVKEEDCKRYHESMECDLEGDEWRKKWL